MPAEGLCLRVTHTGLAQTSIPLSDVKDGVDTKGSFRKAGPVYVPQDASVELVYSGDVAISFEVGAIRTYIDLGHLTAEFIIGTALADLFASILDEGVLLTPTPTQIDFVGAGVTATTVGDLVTVTIPGGGGGGGDHTGLTNLAWTASGHTGTASTLAAFDGAGAAVHISTTVTGDVTGTLPGPLSVSDFTLAGQAQGDILYFDGANWVVLPAGISGQLLQTNGAGANPAWFTATGVGDVLGPGASTDNALVRWNGTTGEFIQDSTGWILGDTGILTGSTGSLILPQNLTPTPTAEGCIEWDTNDHHLYVGSGAGTVTILDDGTAAGGDLGGTYPNPTVTGFSMSGEAQGDVLYFNGTNWVVLPAGASGEFLRTNGAAANPQWATPAGAGDVSGPGASTDNALVRWNGATGTAIQDSSGWILGDSGILDGTSGSFLLPQGLAPAPTGEGSIAWDTNDNILQVGDGSGTISMIADNTAAGGDLGGTYPNPTVTGFSMSGEAQGDVLYFNGTNWVVLAAGTSGQFLQTSGVAANPQWATPTGSGDVSGPGGAVTDNALVRWDLTTGTLIQNSNAILTDAGSLTLANGQTLAVDTIVESTASNGVSLSGTHHYADSATDPTSPTPAEGDRYYNTTLEMEMRYDGLRSKFLSVNETWLHFGRSGNTAANSYFDGAGGVQFTSTNGFPAPFDGTVVGIAVTRDDTDSADVEVTLDGTLITGAEVTTAATSVTDSTLNADFTSSGTAVLGVRNQTGSATMTDVSGWVRIKWRI